MKPFVNLTFKVKVSLGEIFKIYNLCFVYFLDVLIRILFEKKKRI